MISLLLVGHFYPAISCRRARKETESDEFIVYGSVARYGPRTSGRGFNKCKQ